MFAMLPLLPVTRIAAVTYDSRQYLTPYWDSDTMFNETVLMVSDSGKPPVSTLLFPPLAIQSVRNAGLDTVFREGVDWTYANGKLTLPPGSKAASMTMAELYPSVATPGWVQSKVGGGNVLFQEGHYFHDRQLAITYTHARNLWKGPIPKFAETTLPKTLAKLAKGEPIKFVFLGNSITAGYNASAFVGAAPNMPPYAGLVVENLKANYASAVTFKNVAVAGKDAAWGLANADTLVTSEHPDLTVISFGMNDGAAKVPPDTFLTRVKAIMAKVKAGNPAVEFILVAPMTANPETFFAGYQTSYLPKLQTLVGPGVDVVDMSGTHLELLKHKGYRDMTGNNVNHPNDFLHRWYAQEMSGLLIKPKVMVSVNPSPQPGQGASAAKATRYSTDGKTFPGSHTSRILFSN